MCRIEVGEARGMVMRALGWDKPRVIQRGTSRVFRVNSVRADEVTTKQKYVTTRGR